MFSVLVVMIIWTIFFLCKYIFRTRVNLCARNSYESRAREPFEHVQPFVACSEHHLLLVDFEGSVWSCGKNMSGNLGLGHFQVQMLPQKIENLPPIKSVFVGGSTYSLFNCHSVFLDHSGNIWACGNNSWNQLGLEERTSYTPFKYFRYLFTNKSWFYTIPQRIKGLPKIKSVSVQTDFSLFLDTNGNVWAAGFNHCELSRQADTCHPSIVQGLPAIQAIATGDRHALFLDIFGSVWIKGQRMRMRKLFRDHPHRVIRAIFAGYNVSMVVDSDGVVWSSGENFDGQLGLKHRQVVNVPQQTDLPEAREIAFGKQHVLLLDGEDIVWSWGKNDCGQLGRKDVDEQGYSIVPAPIQGLPPIQSICSSGTFSVFVDVDAAVWGCGLSSQAIGPSNEMSQPLLHPEKLKWDIPNIGSCQFVPNSRTNLKSARSTGKCNHI